MSNAVKGLIGVAAAIAVPFAAPAIASTIGLSGAITTFASSVGLGTAAGTIGSVAGGALVGAGLGAATQAVLGGDIGRGALFGGLGGGVGAYFNPSGGIGGAGAAASGPGVTTVSQSALGNTAGLTLGAAPGAAPTAASSYFGGAGAGISQAAGGIGAGASGGLTSMLSGMMTTENLAKITMMALNGEQGMTSEEQALINQRKAELQRMAKENQQLYQLQKEEAQKFFRTRDQAAAQPEKVFGDYRLSAERQTEDMARMLSPAMRSAAQQRGVIEATRLGAVATAQDATRARRDQTELTRAGLNSMPTPTNFEGYAGLAMPMYQDLRESRREDQNDMAYTIGSMFGTSNANPYTA